MVFPLELIAQKIWKGSLKNIMNKDIKEYLEFLNNFVDNLEKIYLTNLSKEPERIAIISVDMINGFCRVGNLSSDRNATLVLPIVRLFKKGWEFGVRDFVLLQDCHNANSKEFQAFAAHSVCGSLESQAVDEIKSLPFFSHMNVIKKNSIHPAHGTNFDKWISGNDHLEIFIVVGNCTDLCVYQTAMHLRTKANAKEIRRRVIIPTNCVNTYDLSLETAKQIKAQPHPGDFLGKIFLHHMSLNAIEVYKKID